MRSRESEWRRCGWTLFIGASLLYAFMGCASAPIENERIIVVEVRNDNWLDAAIYLNGARRGEITGFSSKVILIPQSQLTDGGRCLTADLRTIGDRQVYSAGKQCLSANGGKFTLQLDVVSHLWLTAWSR